MLIKCPECGKDVSDKSKQCIHCGYPFFNDMTSNDINSEYDIILNPCFPDKNKRISIIKCVREVTGLDLKPAMNLVDNAPSVICKNYSYSKAIQIESKFDNIDAPVIIKQHTESGTGILEQKKDMVCCPHCGSSAVTTGQRGFSIFSGFLGSNKTVNRCGKCGWTWSPRN